MSTINPALPASGDSGWGNTLNAAIQQIVAQGNAHDNQISAFGAAATPSAATTTTQGVVQLAGDLSGTASAPVLKSVITAGSVGSSTGIPVITYDAKGRVTGTSVLSIDNIVAGLVSTIGSATRNAVLAIAPLSNSTLPSISGTPTVGQVLTAVNGTWTATPDSYSYVWNRGGVAISGATSQTYTAVAGDSGQQITVAVTAAKSGYTATTAISNPVVISSVQLTNTNAPVITGTTTVGQILTSSPGAWSVVPDSYSYQWKRAGSAITGATSSTYTLVTADGGQQISVTVTAAKSGYTSAVATSTSVTITSSTLTLPYTETFTASNGAAWPSAWTTLGSPTIQNNSGQMVTAATPYSAVYGWLSGYPLQADLEVLTTFTLPAAATVEEYVTIALRASSITNRAGNEQPNTGVFARIAPSFNVVELHKTVSGTDTTSSSASFTFTGNTAYKVRFRALGTNFKVRIWAASGSEPGTWNIDYTDAAAPSQAGQLWLGLMNGTDGVSRSAFFDDITVQSSGSSAIVPNGPTGTWTIPFQDEFTGTSLNTTLWNPSENWTFNGVTEHAANVTVANGVANLILASTSSGAMIQSATRQFQIGDYVEFRAKFPGDGTNLYNWPAVWTVGLGPVGTGEIDIAEVLGGLLTVNYHGTSNAVDYGRPPSTVGTYWGDSFHTFGALRKSSSFDIYWDGVKVMADKPTGDDGTVHYIVAIMGQGTGSPTSVGAALQLDYVRLFRPA